MSQPPDAVDPATVIRYTEKEFEDQVVELAKAMGWLVYHAHDSRQSDWRSDKGFPDWVFVKLDRLVIFAELKGTGGHPTPGQLTWIHSIKENTGVVSDVFWPKDWEALAALLTGEITEVE